MSRYVAAASVVGCVLLVTAVRPAGQDRSYPRAGTEIVTVNGAVDVRQMPPVEAVQSGRWRVALESNQVEVTNAPVVIVSPPGFLRTGQRYAVTWPSGEEEEIVVAELESNGWVRAQATGGSRWVNLAGARAIREARIAR